MNKKNDESKDPKNETASSFKDTRLSKFLHKLPLGTLLFSPSCGYMRVADSHGSDLLMEVYADNTLQSVFFCDDGRLAKFKHGECCLFPSDKYRDWNFLMFEESQFIAMDIVYKDGNQFTYMMMFKNVDVSPQSCSLVIKAYACLPKYSNVLTYDTTFDFYATSSDETQIKLRTASNMESEMLSDAIAKDNKKWDAEKHCFSLQDGSEALRADFNALQRENERLKAECIKIRLERNGAKTRAEQAEYIQRDLLNALHRYRQSVLINTGVDCPHLHVAVGSRECITCPHLMKVDEPGHGCVLCAMRYDAARDKKMRKQKTSGE